MNNGAIKISIYTHLFWLVDPNWTNWIRVNNKTFSSEK